MAQLPDRILQFLNEKGSGDTLGLAELLKEDHQKVIGAVKSLQSAGDVIEAEQLSRTKTELTKEGQSFVDKGSHEAIVFAAIPAGEEGIPHAELNKVAGPAAKIGISKAMQNGWVKITKDGAPKVVRLVESIEDGVKDKLKMIASGDASTIPAAALADLKKRKLLTQTPITYYNVKKGPNFTLKIEKLETELTPEMLASGDWKKKTFKAYNFQALGAPLNPGHLHPLLKVRAEFRSILLEMGFSEMPTNRFVESSFWNFDALYVPQKHPARDAQDTFFMSQPLKCASIPKDLMEKVKAAHTGQDYGTLGYGPVWKEEEAYKNCMRTHTTAVSARMLHAIGSKPEFKPSKLFSIDRVFRNETLDATHLAEFFQVEGVVADYNINLGNLIGILKEFFSRLGITKLRFKPAYNPYTEPSMEVFSYHEGLKKWVEVGNSGMFRPEMLLPLGIPKDVRVVAWGLSLERPTMIRYGIDNIRDLVGPRVDLQMVYNNPICRLDTNFDIGSDGSYLENPLLKSPKRDPVEVVKSPTATSEQEDPVSTKSSKNKKKKKKKKVSESEEAKGKLDSTQSQNQNLSPSDAGDDAKCVAVKDRPVEQPEPVSHKSSNKTSQQELKLTSPSPPTSAKSEKRSGDISRDQIAAARLNVIKSHLQAISESATLASLSASLSSSSAQETATDVNVSNSAPPTQPSQSSKKKKKSKVKSTSEQPK